MSSVAEEKPDNLLWIEEVLLNNLDEEDVEVSNHSLHNIIPTKLTIAEIEMRDENFFGDERVATLSRLIAARIKYIVPSASASSSADTDSDGPDPNDEKIQFWLMKLPSVSPQQRELSRIANVSKREITFYTEILPSLRLWVESQYIDGLIEFKVPVCFYGKYLRPYDSSPDLEIIDHVLQSESLLVLQDLRAHEFGKRYFGEGMTVPEAMAAIAEISKFHAVTYAMQHKSGENLNWKELFSPSDMTALYSVLFKRGVTTFQNFISNDQIGGPQILHAIEKLVPNVKDILIELLKASDHDQFPTTLIHMDLWSDNILFRVKDEEPDPDLDCYIIDWQMVSLGRPSHDIALLTLLSMDAETRRLNAHILLQYYYQVFEQTVGQFDLPVPFNFTRLVEEYSRSCILAVIMAIASMDIVMLEESTQNRLVEAINDLIADGLL